MLDVLVWRFSHCHRVMRSCAKTLTFRKCVVRLSDNGEEIVHMLQQIGVFHLAAS